MEVKKPHFTFHIAEGKKFSALEDKDNKELLQKWSMDGNLAAQMFTFDQAFQPYQKNEFIMDFMRDPTVTASLKVGSTSGPGLVTFGMTADRVEIETVPCTKITMDLFDRLYGPVVRESGQLVRCFDEFSEDFTISDELRKMLLLEEDSDNYELYSDTEKEEFLFRLFRHICLGGQICQYEDTIEPYLNITKQLYKDLVSVQKNPDTKQLSILSSVFKVTGYDKDDEMIYPSMKPHEQTFSYFIVDPLKRHVSVLYHKFAGGIFS